jgi:hypothetical protein
MKRDESERREDLDATSDSLLEDARRLSEIEQEKQGLELGDRRLHELSHEAERVAGQVQEKSRIERELSHPEGDEPERTGRSH